MIKKLIFLFLSVSSLTFSQMAGSGTSNDPYQIVTATDFDDMHNNINAYYKLMNDIDLTGIDWQSLDPASSGAAFHLDGQDYTVSHLTCTTYVLGHQGALITTDGSGSVDIHDIRFDSTYFERTGAFSYNNGYSFVVGEIDASTSKVYNVQVRHSKMLCDASASDPGNIAGIIGMELRTSGSEANVNNLWLDKSRITITGAGSSDVYTSIGGIIGRGYGNIPYSGLVATEDTIDYATAYSSYANIGGVCGDNLGYLPPYISNCYSYKNVFNIDIAGYVGAAVGGAFARTDNSVHNTTFTNCYSGANTYNFLNYQLARTGTFIGIVLTASGKTTTFDGVYSEENATYSAYTTGVLSGTIVGDVTVLTSAEMVDPDNFTGFDFFSDWGTNGNINNNYPYLQWQLSLQIYVLTPETNDYFPSEDISITWTHSNEICDIYYEIAGEATYITESNSPYVWPKPLLNSTVRLKLVPVNHPTDIVYSGYFTIAGVDSIKILYPRYIYGSKTPGDTVHIITATIKSPSYSLWWSQDSTNWIEIEDSVHTDSLTDTTTYVWSLPEALKRGDLWIEARQSGDTTLYSFGGASGLGLKRVGTTEPSQPFICWDADDPNNTVSSNLLICDPSCGWVAKASFLVRSTINDDGTAFNYQSFNCPSGDCQADRDSSNLAPVVYLDGVGYTEAAIYEHGSSVTYRGRTYYYDATDSVIKMNDDVNGIDGISLVDMKKLLSGFDGMYWRGFTGDISFNVYNVQYSKINHQSYTGVSNIEDLNSSDFSPSIQVVGPYYGHGGLLVARFEALGFPPVLVNGHLVKDTKHIAYDGGEVIPDPTDPAYPEGATIVAEPLNITRGYFRGIDPKASKKGR